LPYFLLWPGDKSYLMNYLFFYSTINTINKK